MLKKLILTSLLFASQISLAETCPTITDIKSNYLHGWQALNIDSASPISATTFEIFKNNIQNFALAEWMKGAPEGEAHCYYHGAQQDGEYLGVFLAKANLESDNTSSSWQRLNNLVSQCHANVEACQFLTHQKQ